MAQLLDQDLHLMSDQHRGFYQRMTTRNQRHGFFVVHTHVAKVARIAAAAESGSPL